MKITRFFNSKGTWKDSRCDVLGQLEGVGTGAPASPVRRGARSLAGAVGSALMFLAVVFPAVALSATVDLASVLDSSGPTVTLNSGNTYILQNEYRLTKDRTIHCGGAFINAQGVLKATGSGVHVGLDHCQLVSTAWGGVAAAAGANLSVSDSSISCTGGTAVYVSAATVTLTRVQISNSRFGVNLEKGGSLTATTLTVQNCPYAVQASGSSSFISLDQNCSLNYTGGGTGIGLLQGAHGTVRHTTITGFSNGIDLQPPAPVGTISVYDSKFVDNNVSAVSAVGAQNVLIRNCEVRGAGADGIYFENSTGTIERSVISTSANTGVTFLGCSGGATLADSTVEYSKHQGVAIVKDDDSAAASKNIKVLGNTLRHNTLGDIYVDATSDAQIIGNILMDSQDTSIKLHGPKNIACHANYYLIPGDYAVEIKDGASADISLSYMIYFKSGAILLYGKGSKMTLEHSQLDVFSGSASADAYEIFINQSASAVVEYNDLGHPWEGAAYNNAGAWSNFANNYWGSSAGPTIGSSGAGGGATLDWNATNGSTVTYQPYLTTSPIYRYSNHGFSVSPGTTTHWDVGDITISVTGAAGTTPVSSEVMSILQSHDTSHLDTLWPAPAQVDGNLYAVWISTPIRRAAQRIRFDFYYPYEGPFYLVKRDTDGFWSTVSSTWDESTHSLSATFSNPFDANGIFSMTTAKPPLRSDMRNMITHFYRTVLGRDPEAGAVDAWEKGYFAYALSLDIDVRFIPMEMGRLFFLSREYADRHRSDAQFITDCYQAFLYRDPEPGALDAWLAGEWNRAEAMSVFAESDEFKNRVQNLFPGFTGNGVRNLVTSLYIGLLDRLADKGGLIYWADYFSASGNYTDAAKALGKTVVVSTEFKNAKPTNDDIVVRLYRGYLGRFPSDQEVSYWAGQLRSGASTVNQLIDLFAASREFQNRISEMTGS